MTSEKECDQHQQSSNALMRQLDRIYDSAARSAQEMADEYTSRYRTIEQAANTMIRNQLIKTTVSGTISGIGGFASMLVTIPANIAHVLYVQIQMLQCLAVMGGYSINSDEVRTLIYACWAGLALGNNVVKPVAVKVGTKLGTAAIKKIPGKILIKINKIVGFRLFTKFGSKGTINLGKAIPFIGALIGGGMDYASTKLIAKRGFKNFIENNFDIGDRIDLDDDQVFDGEIVDG